MIIAERIELGDMPSRSTAPFLDEPLSALDHTLRSELQAELKDLQRKTGLTRIYVTHDQDEALPMAVVVAVMSAEQIKQIGRPFGLYERPMRARSMIRNSRPNLLC